MAPLAKTLALVGTFGLATATGGDNGTALGSSVDMADPRVFSPYFYLYNNPDVLHAGVVTPDAARDHWRNSGISEGRQASGAFHARQYLDRYPDLKASLGEDFRAAVRHYLTNGAKEGRLGFAEDGGPYGRWTIADQELGIFVSASSQMAGAVDSLVWGHHEFINSRDHGRQLQIAMTTDDHAECFNPTEAGSRNDGDATTTTSVLQGITTAGNVLQTTVLPAFWLGPGDQETLDVPGCTVSLAPDKVSNYVTSKAVSFRPFDIRGAIKYSFTINMPEAVSKISIEGPSNHLTQPFTAYYTVDLNSGALAGLSHDVHEQPSPVIFATPDGSHAMGAYSPPSQGEVSYASYDVTNIGTFADGTNSWSMVFRLESPPTTLSFTTYICVGSLSNVHDCIVSLHAQAGQSATVQV